MDIEIQKQKDVPLLNRQRVSLLVMYDGGATPSIVQFTDIIASKLHVDKDLVAIRHVYQKYGSSQAKVIAHVYKTREERMRLEKLKKGERKILEAAKKVSEEKAKEPVKKVTKEDVE